MTSFDDLPCPECGRPCGQHTLTEYRDHTATRLGFEQVAAPFPTTAEGHVMVDHLDVAALVIQMDTAAGSLTIPGVEFRFWSSAGERPPPIVFVSDDEQMFKELGRLIVGACGAAPMRARQANRGGTP